MVAKAPATWYNFSITDSKRLRKETQTMKNTMYILGSVEALIGAVLLWLTKLIAESLPVLGHVAFQARGGSYSPDNYRIHATFLYGIGWGLLILGILQVTLAFCKKKIREDSSC